MKDYCGNKLKYVANHDTGEFVIFGLGTNHSNFSYLHPTSAGFVQFFKYGNDMSSSNMGAECFGESQSLGLFSDPVGDSDLITRALMFH